MSSAFLSLLFFRVGWVNFPSISADVGVNGDSSGSFESLVLLFWHSDNTGVFTGGEGVSSSSPSARPWDDWRCMALEHLRCERVLAFPELRREDWMP